MYQEEQTVKEYHPKSLVCSGVLNPDITGLFVFAGRYNERAYFSNGNGRYIWWHLYEYWAITQEVGGWGEGGYWVRNDYNVKGNYNPTGEASGSATITEVP